MSSARVRLSWSRFFKQFQKDLKFWGFCVVFLQLYRLLFIFWFRQHIGEAGKWTDVAAAALNGLRYDSMVASYSMMVPFLASLSCGFFDTEAVADRLRLGFGIFFVAFSTALCRASLGYYEEFGDVFNHWVLGLYYDDARAVFGTIEKQHNLFLNFIAAGAVVAAGVIVLLRTLRRPFVSGEAFGKYLSTPARKAAASVLIVVFLIVGLRGSLGTRPTQRKDAGVTVDPFLNKSVLNPHVALKYALKEHRRISGSAGLGVYLPDGDIIKAAKYAFATNETHDELDSYMRKRARGPRNRAARHVFIIVMESYDAWPLLEGYESLILATRLKRLAEQGLHVTSFLPSSDGTMSSLSSIITGLPDAGVVTNYRRSAKKPYRSSLPVAFKRLGYRTRLFYSGYLEWQRIGDFCRAQGFEEVYGSAHVGSWSSANEWGVDDEYVFDFVAGKVEDGQPSLNIILTTTNHPPYDVDVWGKGYPVGEIPEHMKPLFNTSVDLEMLGHLWYSDRCLGEFVEAMEEKLTSPVFAITGDHFSRRHMNSTPPFFEKSAVPLVLYGREVLEGVSLPDGAAGSHIDIGPTLIGLAAPRGFEYYSVGNDLLAPRRKSYGVARGKVIGTDFILDVRDNLKLHPVPGRSLPEKPPDVKELKRLHDALHAVAWWYVMKGPVIRSE